MAHLIWAAWAVWAVWASKKPKQAQIPVDTSCVLHYETPVETPAFFAFKLTKYSRKTDKGYVQKYMGQNQKGGNMKTYEASKTRSRFSIGIAGLSLDIPLGVASGINAHSYLDDRSGPTELVSSYYNAINRHEFARAWSYWRQGAAGDPYLEFVGEFADTLNIDAAIGQPVKNPDMDGVLYQVPVATEVSGVDGSVLAYAGCFVLRSKQANMQQIPFTPLQIEQVYLKPVNETYSQRADSSYARALASEHQ